MGVSPFSPLREPYDVHGPSSEDSARTSTAHASEPYDCSVFFVARSRPPEFRLKRQPVRPRVGQAIDASDSTMEVTVHRQAADVKSAGGQGVRIDFVQMPKIEGLRPEEAIQALYKHCHETAVLLMRMNNDVEDLKNKLRELDSRLRFR